MPRRFWITGRPIGAVLVELLDSTTTPPHGGTVVAQWWYSGGGGSERVQITNIEAKALSLGLEKG